MVLTKEEVRKLYFLFDLGLDDTSAIDYWSGKPLNDLLDARIADKRVELAKLG